jgi:hypothetical protein
VRPLAVAPSGQEIPPILLRPASSQRIDEPVAGVLSAVWIRVHPKRTALGCSPLHRLRCAGSCQTARAPRGTDRRRPRETDRCRPTWDRPMSPHVGPIDVAPTWDRSMSPHVGPIDVAPRGTPHVGPIDVAPPRGTLLACRRHALGNGAGRDATFPGGCDSANASIDAPRRSWAQERRVKAPRHSGQCGSGEPRRLAPRCPRSPAVLQGNCGAACLQRLVTTGDSSGGLDPWCRSQVTEKGR